MKRRYKAAIIATLLVVLAPYGCAALNRTSAQECKRETQATLYVGEVCFLASRLAGMRFRIYDEQTGELLAERTYNSLDPAIVWGNDRVWYSGDDEYVALPPTWWDRLRAKLP